MKDEEMVVNQTTPLEGPSILFSRPYRLFILPAKQLGKSATNAFLNFGSILHKKSINEPLERLFINTKVAKDEEHSKKMEKLSRVIVKANETIASATAVFPFDLFPDTVTVDRTKVTITRRGFFWSSEVISLRIEDILNVTTSVGPFFGSITVSSRVMNSVDQFQISYFWRRDAIRLKHIIQGYVIALHNKIDIEHLTKNELVVTLSELGHDAAA